MDKVKILRLIDEADDIVSALYRQGANKDYKCKSLREKLKAITEEITAPPKSNADSIRQMTDDELAKFIDIYDIEDICKTRCAKTGEARERCMCYGEGCRGNIMQWLKQEVSKDVQS